jgi:hypothetical protein
MKHLYFVPYDTKPCNHFSNIVDLWKNEWDRSLGTVPAENINREFLENLEDYEDTRTVIHYMQPHAPFIGSGKGKVNNHLQNKVLDLVDRNGSFKKENEDRFVDLSFSNFVSRVEDLEISMKLGCLQNLDLRSLWEVLNNGLRSTLIDFHEENMRYVIRYAQEIAEEADAKVIITSDHREAYGEQEVWGHHIET